MGSKWNSELYCSLKRWKPRATPYHMQVWYPTQGQGWEDPHTTRPAAPDHGVAGSEPQACEVPELPVRSLPHDVRLSPNPGVAKIRPGQAAHTRLSQSPQPPPSKTLGASVVPATHVPFTKHIPPHPIVYVSTSVS